MQKGPLAALSGQISSYCRLKNLDRAKEQLLVAGGVGLVTDALLNPKKGGNTINNAECFLEDARKSFGLASKAKGQKEVERYAAMGRDYLMLAHRAATVDTVPPSTSFWGLP